MGVFLDLDYIVIEIYKTFAAVSVHSLTLVFIGHKIFVLIITQIIHLKIKWLDYSFAVVRDRGLYGVPDIEICGDGVEPKSPLLLLHH